MSSNFYLSVPPPPRPRQPVTHKQGDSLDAYFDGMKRAIVLHEEYVFEAATTRYHQAEGRAEAVVMDARNRYASTLRDLVEWFNLEHERCEREQKETFLEQTVPYTAGLVNNYGITHDPVRLAVDAFEQLCLSQKYRVVVTPDQGYGVNGVPLQMIHVRVEWGMEPVADVASEEEAVLPGE